MAVAVEISSVSEISENSFQVEWLEQEGIPAIEIENKDGTLNQLAGECRREVLR